MRGRVDRFASAVVAFFLHPDAIFAGGEVAFEIAVDLGRFFLAIGAAVAMHLAFVGFLRVVDVKESVHIIRQ